MGRTSGPHWSPLIIELRKRHVFPAKEVRLPRYNPDLLAATLATSWRETKNGANQEECRMER